MSNQGRASGARSRHPHPGRPRRQQAGRPAAAAYQWRLAASRGAALQRLPQSEHHPAVGHVEPARSSRSPAAPLLSREAGERSGKSGEEGKGGALNGGGCLCAGSWKGPGAIVLRCGLLSAPPPPPSPVREASDGEAGRGGGVALRVRRALVSAGSGAEVNPLRGLGLPRPGVLVGEGTR